MITYAGEPSALAGDMRNTSKNGCSMPSRQPNNTQTNSLMPHDVGSSTQCLALEAKGLECLLSGLGSCCVGVSLATALFLEGKSAKGNSRQGKGRSSSADWSAHDVCVGVRLCRTAASGCVTKHRCWVRSQKPVYLTRPGKRKSLSSSSSSTYPSHTPLQRQPGQPWRQHH